jgi:hypothetical protein
MFGRRRPDFGLTTPSDYGKSHPKGFILSPHPGPFSPITELSTVRALRLRIILILLLAILAAPPVRAEFEGGLLRQTAAETRSTSAVEPAEEEPQDRRKQRDKEKKKTTFTMYSHGSGPDLLSLAAFYTVTSPYWVPAKALGDDGHHLGYFQSYPHQDYEGYMLKGSPEFPLGRLVSIRAAVEYDNDFHDLSRIGTKVLVEGSHRFGLDLQWNEYFDVITSELDAAPNAAGTHSGRTFAAPRSWGSSNRSRSAWRCSSPAPRS